MRRITKAALGGLAGCALVLGGTQTAIGDSVRELFSDSVLDLDSAGTRTPPTTGAFDSAEALLKVTETSDSTTLWIRVKGIDVDFAGNTFGSHLHIGGCGKDGYDAVGPHFPVFPVDPDNLSQPLREREAWFDLIPNEYGVAVDKVVVAVAPSELVGAQSIVIHAQATNEATGTAGPKEVCLPLAVGS